MSVRMTEDQLRAVRTLEGDVAVRAGAGSGKTSVLAHRFAYALEAGVRGSATEADRLLTITFTSKAAAEVAERVRKVVGREISADQARRIDQGWISTIHSFCARIVRRHMLEAGLDASFGQADEVTAAALKSEAFERAARLNLERDPTMPALFDMMSLRELQSRVIACHDKARTLGLDPAASAVILDEVQLAGLAAQVLRDADELRWALQSQRQTTAVVANCEGLISWTDGLASCSLDDAGCEDIVAACDAYAVRGSGEAKAANLQLKDSLARLRRAALAFRYTAEMGGIERLIRTYAAEYRSVKRERGLLDFDDLQELAVSLLEQDPRIAELYRKHFDLVMVDEFQDTNALQMRVLAPLRSDNLCIVGDERQSIYGFRYADVEIFAEESAAMEQQVGLRSNFRSHPEVLGFINDVFGHSALFGSDFMRLDAGRDSGWVVAGMDDVPRVECLFVHTGERLPVARRSEAEHIASRIESLLDGHCHAGDIAVLLRSATNAGVYAAALEQRGIPVLVNAGASLYDTPEIAELSALLRAIAVPEDDEALLATLSGRVVALSDPTLLAISRAAEKRSLWSGLCRLAEAGEPPNGIEAVQFEALKGARANLEAVSARQGSTGLSQLVEEACEAFDYDITLHAQGPAGVRAWANVQKVRRLADAFERAEANDLAEFVDHLGLRETAAPDKPAPGDAGGQAVRIMTIHSAKGLQFPVVFVADLAAAKRHAAPSVLVEAATSSSGRVPVVGVRLPKEPYGAATTPAYLEMEDVHSAREVAEEKRCLYVACTRAEELLIVSGASNLEKPAEEGSALIDWVREAIGPAVDGSQRVDGVGVHVEELFPEPAASEEAVEISAGPPVALCPPARPAERPEHVRREVPSTVSYSALHLYEQCPLSFHAKYGLRMGKAAPEAAGPLAFGSALHAALRWSLHEGLTDERREAIVRGHGLDDEDRRRLQRTIDSFLGSELASRARVADRSAAEEPLLVALAETVLVGSIDLIAWEGERALIIDYKTGQAPGPGPDPVRESAYRLQAECYALSAIEAGATDVTVSFAFVEHPQITRDFAFVPEDALAIRERLGALVERIATDRASHLDTYRADLCGQCPALGGLCPIVAPPGRG